MRLLLPAVASVFLCACTFSQPGARFAGPVDDRFFSMNGTAAFHQKVTPGHTHDSIRADLRKRLTIMKDLGVVGVRTDFWWGVIEPAKDQFEWEFPDLVIDEIIAAGMKPYPIFNYGSAWQHADAPVTDEERALFGRYVRNVVTRYKDRVDTWEVWNEPNILPFWAPTPRAEDYVELLKIAYTEARAADPECTIVGICAAGADYEFIEKCYRAGAGDYMDVLSWHHYDSRYREEIFENEIRRIRRIMQRYGDGHIPMYITEAGLSTGESTIVDETSPEQQASWIVKKHLIALAEGVQQFHYFKLMDDEPAPGVDGYWGLVDWKENRKPSYAAYKEMSAAITGADYLGRLPVTGELERLLFRKDGELFTVSWVRNDGGAMLKGVPLTSTPAAPTVSYTKLPTYERNLPDEVERSLNRIQSAVVFLSPGQSVDISTSLNKEAMAHLLKQLEKRGIATSGNLTLHLPADTPEFPPFTARTMGGQLTIFYEQPFDLNIIAAPAEQNLLLTLHSQNLLATPASGTVEWIMPEGVRDEVDGFTNLPPGGQREFVHKIPPVSGEHKITVTMKDQSGASARDRHRIHGQTFLPQPLLIDGDGSDWSNIPAAHLTPAEMQTRPHPFEQQLTETDASANVQVAWTADSLLVFANITDATPMLNPHEGTFVWKGDSFELYLGFDGPTQRNLYGPREFHIALTPGDSGRDPHAWNWNPLPQNAADGGRRIPGARVATRRTQHGYTLEVLIPLLEFNESMSPGRVLAFDMQLNNACTPAGDQEKFVLIWNGDDQNWRYPGDWGAAFVKDEGARMKDEPDRQIPKINP